MWLADLPWTLTFTLRGGPGEKGWVRVSQHLLPQRRRGGKGQSRGGVRAEKQPCPAPSPWKAPTSTLPERTPFQGGALVFL